MRREERDAGQEDVVCMASDCDKPGVVVLCWLDLKSMRGTSQVVSLHLSCLVQIILNEYHYLLIQILVFRVSRRDSYSGNAAWTMRCDIRAWNSSLLSFLSLGIKQPLPRQLPHFRVPFALVLVRPG